MHIPSIPKIICRPRGLQKESVSVPTWGWGVSHRCKNSRFAGAIDILLPELKVVQASLYVDPLTSLWPPHAYCSMNQAICSPRYTYIHQKIAENHFTLTFDILFSIIFRFLIIFEIKYSNKRTWVEMWKDWWNWLFYRVTRNENQREIISWLNSNLPKTKLFPPLLTRWRVGCALTFSKICAKFEFRTGAVNLLMFVQYR